MYTPADGLAGNYVEDIVVDHSGNAWFAMRRGGGTIGNGISRFDGTSWTHYHIDDGLPSHIVYSLAVDSENNVWAATHGGVAKYNGSSWETYTTADGLRNNFVTLVAAHGTDIWVAYYLEPYVGHFDGVVWNNYMLSVPGQISAFDFDNSGRLWAATGQNITVRNGTDWINHPIASNQPLFYTTGMAVDKGYNVWVGALGHTTWTGINRFDGNAWINYTTANGLPGDEVDDVVSNEARNNIWFSLGDAGVTQLRLYHNLNESVYLPMIGR